MQRTSWTLAAPFKEQHHYRGPSDSIANNYSLTAQDLKLKDLLKVYQPVTINAPREKNVQGLPLGICSSVAIPAQNGVLGGIFSPGFYFSLFCLLQLTLDNLIDCQSVKWE